MNFKKSNKNKLTSKPFEIRKQEFEVKKKKKNKEELERVKNEIDIFDSKLKRFKKRIPIHLIIGTLITFIYPFFPGRHGNDSLVESYGYKNSVIFTGVLFILCYFIIHLIIDSKWNGKLKLLKKKKEYLEKELNKV